MLVDYQIAKCKAVLSYKGDEYVKGEDVFEHFKKAASLQGINTREALFGMLAKHIVSISELCAEEHCAPTEIWNEKICDAINYLILLSGVVRDELKAEIEEMKE